MPPPVTLSGPAIPVHLRVMLAYSGVPPLDQVASDVVREDYKRVFDSVNIESGNIRFRGPTRSMQLTQRAAFFSGAGDPLDGPLLDGVFSILQAAKADRIVQIAPTLYFAVGVQEKSLENLVQEHVALLKHATFNMGILGKIVDSAVVLRFVNDAGPVVNCQYGPMGQKQWVTFGGPEAVAIESSLPPVAWGIGFYYEGNIPIIVDMSLEEAKAQLVGKIKNWWAIASGFFS
jgi:hypothetical protein